MASRLRDNVLRDERYWYGSGWPELRSNLVRLCLEESGELLDVVMAEDAGDSGIEGAVVRFVDHMLLTIQQRLDANRSADRWHHSLRLMVEPGRLAKALIRQQKQFAAKSRDLEPEALLGTILRSHFEQMRRELQTEHSPHRLKVWEQIDRVSRELMGVDDDPRKRLSSEHQEAVLRELGQRFPTSRNLPRALTTLQDYFDEFCPAAQPDQLGEHHDAISGGEPPEPILASERKTTFDELGFLEEVTGFKPDPMACFQELPEAHAEAFAVAHRLQADLLTTDTPFANARACYLGRGISKRRFYRLVREATDLLLQCLNRRIDEEP